MSLEVVGFLSAEIVLVAAALLIYMGGAFSTSQKAWAPIAFIALALAAASLWSCGGNEQYVQNVMHRLSAAAIERKSIRGERRRASRRSHAQ